MPVIGDVVRDRFGQVGIVCQMKERPPQDCIDKHLYSEDIKNTGSVNWWGVLSMKGGYLRVAEPMLTVLRKATYEDFLSAADKANVSGRKYLAAIFPDYVGRALRERRLGESS